MKKIIAFGTLSILLAGCGNQASQSNVENNIPEENDGQAVETATIAFDIDDQLYTVNEEDLERKVEWTDEVTLLEVMQDQFDVIDEGGLITSIEGYEQIGTKNAYWLYDINGESAMVGAGDYVLEDGDEILWNLKMNQSDE